MPSGNNDLLLKSPQKGLSASSFSQFLNQISKSDDHEGETETWLSLRPVAWRKKKNFVLPYYSAISIRNCETPLKSLEGRTCNTKLQSRISNLSKTSFFFQAEVDRRFAPITVRLFSCVNHMP
jgi:hypothetical protein